MTAPALWGALKAVGYTKYRVLDVGPPRSVILQSRDKDEFPSIPHPDDLTPEQREEVLEEFLRHRR